MQLININKELSTLNLECLILEKFGISTEILLINGRKSIKLDSVFSLMTLIKELRTSCDFTIFHKRNTDEYILTILND